MHRTIFLPHQCNVFLLVSEVIFIACDRSRCAVRFLLTLHNRDKVQKLKEEVIRVATPQTNDIVIAEVLNGHVSRVLVRTS